MDLYGNQKRYERIKNELIRKYSGEVKEIFKQYVALHDSKFEREQMAYGSALRSLEVADLLCGWEGFFDEKPYSVPAVKEWWKYQLSRKSKQTGDKVKVSTLHKLQGQASKFLKFLEFIDSGEDMIFFNTHKLPPAKASRYFIVEVPKKKKEITRLDLDKFIETLNILTKSALFYDRLAGAMMISAYDLGCRCSEIASLKNKSFQTVEGTLIINLEDSKTSTRTVVPILSKKYLLNWQANSPTKDDPEGYFFCSRFGGALPYDKVSAALKKASEKTGLQFPNNKLWHFLRHEFASRAYQMPENLIRYYCGWSSKNIRSVYSHNNWKECLPYLNKMNENHPLLDEPLSVLEKEEKGLFEKQLEAMVESKVKNWINKDYFNKNEVRI